MQIRPASETFIRAVDYLDGDMVTLYLGRPNVDITLPTEAAKDPLKVRHGIQNKFGGRHPVYGRSFDDLTRGMCRKRWSELMGKCPLGINGRFSTLDGETATLAEVLKCQVS